MKSLISAFMFLMSVNVFASEAVQLDHYYQGDDCGATFEKVEDQMPFQNKITILMDYHLDMRSIEFSYSKMLRSLKNKGTFKISAGKPDSFWGYSFVEIKKVSRDGKTFLNIETAVEPSNFLIGIGQHARCEVEVDL